MGNGIIRPATARDAAKKTAPAAILSGRWTCDTVSCVAASSTAKEVWETLLPLGGGRGEYGQEMRGWRAGRFGARAPHKGTDHTFAALRSPVIAAVATLYAVHVAVVAAVV